MKQPKIYDLPQAFFENVNIVVEQDLVLSFHPQYLHVSISDSLLFNTTVIINKKCPS